ncbi:hypothetical protein C2S52_005997 [Perilla frutescens var. hirtella]|nr:hypothetical protein C2S51_009764 [Perilla frutescens var. frutescens]KAH6786445.1 hypothetical protein C2S52_005997 [Perilla frutescens var. hirtella]
MLSIKVVLISTSVLSAAIMLSATDIADYVPWIYNGVVSWLRPPYLYLVINCIIITIVASSKLQPTSDDVPAPPPPIAPPVNTISAAQQQPVEISQLNFLIPTTDFKYEGVEKGLELDELGSRGSSKSEDSPPPSIVVSGGADDAMRNKENEFFAVDKSTWTAAAENNDVSNYVKPPASARFSHRRNVKGSPEGGRTVLGVSKPKKQDTLENTWKTITEGRAIPISRHLKKSETWERGRRHNQQENTPPLKTMRKVETFNDRTTTTTNVMSPASGGSGKLRKEPSLSQDELNKRVEAFIKKFNEEMRLQRQDSLNQYKEMINRGSS